MIQHSASKPKPTTFILIYLPAVQKHIAKNVRRNEKEPKNAEKASDHLSAN